MAVTKFLSVFPRSWSNLPIRFKALAIVSVPIATLILLLALMSALHSSEAESVDLTKNSLDIRAQLQNMYILLISAESEVRNYGLNKKEGGIQTLAMLDPSIDALFVKTSDMIEESEHMRQPLWRLKDLIRRRTDGLKALRAYYESTQGHSEPPAPALLHDARISPDVLLAIADFGGKLAKPRVERMKDAETRQASLRSAIYWTAGIGGGSGLLVALLFARGKSRRLRRLEERAASLDEGTPVDKVVAGNDEIGRLARALERSGEAVARRTEELKLALEAAEVLIWELEPASGRIRYQTGSGALRNAHIPAELLPETVDKWIAVMSVEDRERIRQELSHVSAEGGSFQVEYRAVPGGGETRWMTVKARSQSRGDGTQRLLGVLADTTNEKVAAQKIELQARELADSREALERQTRILQSILDSMGDGVIVVDTAGQFVVFNPAARQMLSEGAFSGDPDRWAQRYGLFLPDMVTLYPADQLPLVRAMRGESVDHSEIYVRPAGAADGSWSSITARPLRRENGEIWGGVVVIRDITSAKKDGEALKTAKMDAEEANQAKSEFLSRMSHELRTPLNSILGFAQILELGGLTEEQGENVAHILKGGYHLLDLINEILDLARIESGRMSLSPEPVLIREALQDAVDLVRPLAIQQHITLSAEVAMRCQHHVHADQQRLKQVLLNLLSNAIKYNRQGGSVIVSCVPKPEGVLRIEVVDTGIGIPAEGLKQIFKPFERLSADSTGVSGTGLGLALSKRLVEAMGGTMGVESSVGTGSRFYVELAITDDPVEWLNTEDVSTVLVETAPRLHRGTVLYVEDNAANVRLVEQILSHSPDIRLLTAMHGELGLDLAELHKPDWILLDVHLPDIPGFEVLRRLRLSGRTSRIPVTVLSADATAGQISRLLEAGARDYLTKPLDVRKFLGLLESTIPTPATAAVDAGNAYAERDH